MVVILDHLFSLIRVWHHKYRCTGNWGDQILNDTIKLHKSASFGKCQLGEVPRQFFPILGAVKIKPLIQP